MKVLGLEKIKESLINSGMFKVTGEWENGLVFSGINNPYEITFHFYGGVLDKFEAIVGSNGKRSDRIIDVKGHIDLILKHIEEFKVGTTSFGDVTTDEALKVVENYKLAIEIATKLNSIFFE